MFDKFDNDKIILSVGDFGFPRYDESDKRVFEEKKRERFQNRVLVAMFCLSIAILGYIVVWQETL